jgi:putative tricarboxylic transport membrane protein
MENIALLIQGFSVALSLDNLLAATGGAILGILIGAMPGVGALTGVSLLLPLVFKTDPTTGIIFLAGIYYGNMYGGSYSAILINVPGDSPAIMSCLDGYQLTGQGKAGKALFTSNFASFLGSSVGIILLTIIGPALAEVGLQFGPVEITSLIILALSSIGWMLGDDPLKGLVSTGIGVLIATIGVDLALGQKRFTFGSLDLLSGLNFISLVIGMFGFAQVMVLMTSKKETMTATVKKLTIRESLLTWPEIKKILPVIFRGSILGNFVGVLPGAGATTASFLSYMMEKRIGKNRENMGKGALEGVAAAESADNAAAAGSFAPLLALGIPGSATSAVLLGGLMMWGLRPGPLLFKENPEFVWGLIASMYVGNLICIGVGFAMIPFLINLLKIPIVVMNPIVMIICIVGAFSVNNSMFDVWLMLGSGVIAYFFIISNYPVAPLLLAFILTPRLETATRQSFDISGGNPLIFIQKPISLVLLVITALFMIAPLAMKFWQKNSSEKSCRL